MKKIICILMAMAVLGVIGIPAYAAKAPAKTQAIPVKASAKAPVTIGLRGGLGTDLSGGLAIGANGNYQVDLGGTLTELGISLYLANNKSDSTSGIYRYTEKTSLVVFGAMANFLLNYTPGTGGLFFLAGIGLAAINVSWTEESPNDTSLGTLLPGGGSKQSTDAFAGGSVLNLGVGYLFENGFDLRFEVPTIVVFGAPGKAAGVVPTFTLTGGIRL